MEVLPLGCYFKPTDNDILIYLRDYVRPQPRPSGFILEYDHVNNFQVDQPPDVRMFGSSGSLYCYAICSFRPELGQIKRLRSTSDGRGTWKCTRREEAIHDENGLIAGYKLDFRFRRWEGRETASTTWVMTEYTLKPNSSTNNQYAVCVLRNTQKKVN